jgi:pimeloyl-ACP methyl ester carboxylesterase
MKKYIVLLLLSMMTLTGNAQGYTAEYVDLGQQTGVIYRPASSTAKAAVAIVVMHSHEDYLGFIANGELAKRGYTVLATVPSRTDLIEEKVLNIAKAVNYLKQQPGIRKVVLLGHSGGATVITAYEDLAENGRKALDGKLYTDYSHRIDSLAPADGLLLLDANPGLSTVMLTSLDPNVTDENSGRSLTGTYTYQDEAGYMRGQRERYNRLVQYAQNRLKAIGNGQGAYTDDEPMVIPGSNSIRPFNKLYTSDIRLLAHTKKAWPLLKADGTIATQIVPTVRAPFTPMDASEKLSTAQQLTVREFLSTYAMRVDSDYAITADGFRGIHFDSNLTSPIGNIEGIRIPSLFMGMTGSYEFMSAEAIYDNSPAKDKSLGFVEGASHNFTPDAQAERYHHTSYGDTVKRLFDYVDAWLTSRFAK